METHLNDLIARLEAAHGPDRSLDYDIAMHLDAPFGAWDSFRKYDAAFPTYTRRDAPAYTSSIEAALTLVPECAVWTLEASHAWVRILDGDDVREFQAGFNQHEAELTALALCIAALKARASLSGKGEAS